MKRIVLTIFTVVFALYSCNFLLADDDLTTGSSGGQFEKKGAAGGQFLKIGVGARANGMGGAYAAAANDLTSIFWNAAGLAQVKSMAADFSHSWWFGGFTHSYAAFAMPLGEDFTVGASLISFSSDDIPVTTMDFQSGTGNHYTVSDLMAGLTISGFLTQEFSFGITAKYVKQGFTSLTSNGFAFDVGTMYNTGISGIKLGFSIQNLGTEQELTGQDLKTIKKLYDELNAMPLDIQYLSSPYTLPLIFRAGIMGDIFNTEEHRLLVALDFITLSDTPEQFLLGAEYSWNDFVFVRGGYNIGHDQLGLGGGFGIKYQGGGFDGKIDYSINPTNDLGLINRLSVQLVMGN